MGFIANALGLGGGNDFKAQQAQLANTDYASQLQKLLQGGALNQVDFSGSNAVGGQQSALANALLQTAQGAGPSVAQNQLNNTTNQNISQGAGMIGSQKGLNPALAARMILNNTANANQNAAGQGALLRANETLGAQNTLGSVLGQQRGQDISQSLGTVQSGLNQVGTLGGLQNAQNVANIQNQQGTDSINQRTAEENAKRGSGILGGLLGGAGSILTGGITKGILGDIFGGGGDSASGGTPTSGGSSSLGLNYALPTPTKPSWMGSTGGKVPGQAETSGDSPKNDTVPAMLSPGEIVIPKSASKDPEKAKAFIDALMKHKQSMMGEEPSFGHVLAAQRGLHDRLSMLEKMCYGGVA